MATATVMESDTDELACVLIPLQRGQLLLPSVCIAEIMPWRRIKPGSELPDWCLGLLGWRGETVPVIRFERLNAPRDAAPAAGRCLVVMNRTGAGAQRFYALACEGLPRLVQLTEADLSEADQRPGKAEDRVVRLGAETASIPSLPFIEQRVAALRPGG